MARKPRLSVYERIVEKENEIKLAEETLAKLNEELQDLFKERDKLEMEKLFAMMKENGLTIDKALDLLQVNNKSLQVNNKNKK